MGFRNMMYAYIHTIHTHKQTDKHTYIHTCTHRYTLYVWIFVYSILWQIMCTHRIHTHKWHMWKCVCICIYIYTYIHTRAHTQVNTNIQLQCDVLMLPTSSRTCSALSRWKVVNWTREWKRTQLASHVKRFTGSHRVCMLSGIQRYFAQLHSNDSTNHTTGWFCSTTALVLSIHPQPFAYT